MIAAPEVTITDAATFTTGKEALTVADGDQR
jgi:hypothetical protein